MCTIEAKEDKSKIANNISHYEPTKQPHAPTTLQPPSNHPPTTLQPPPIHPSINLAQTHKQSATQQQRNQQNHSQNHSHNPHTKTRTYSLVERDIPNPPNRTPCHQQHMPHNAGHNSITCSGGGVCVSKQTATAKLQTTISH